MSLELKLIKLQFVGATRELVAGSETHEATGAMREHVVAKGERHEATEGATHELVIVAGSDTNEAVFGVTHEHVVAKSETHEAVVGG